MKNCRGQKVYTSVFTDASVGKLPDCNTTFKIPRKIKVEACKTDVYRYCEKFSNICPFPVEEQNCQFEPKKICKLEMKTRPKKAKKYNYTKDCKKQPREIYDQGKK